MAANQSLPTPTHQPDTPNPNIPIPSNTESKPSKPKPAKPDPSLVSQTHQIRIQNQTRQPRFKPDNPAHPKPIPASQTRWPKPQQHRIQTQQTKPGSHESEPKPKADGARSYIPISQPQDAAVTPQSPPRQQTNPKPPRTTFQSTSRAPQSPATIRQIVPRQRRIQRNRTSRFSGTNHSDAHRKCSPMCLVR